MKIQSAPASSKSRASVVIIVMVLLGVMALLIVSNNLTLARLDKNLKLIEQKQLRKAGVSINKNKQRTKTNFAR